jgi:hypothetical protein
MKTVVLGQTGLRVSRVGIGGIPLTRPTEDETVKLVRHALDLGITFIHRYCARVWEQRGAHRQGHLRPTGGGHYRHQG